MPTLKNYKLQIFIDSEKSENIIIIINQTPKNKSIKTFAKSTRSISPFEDENEMRESEEGQASDRRFVCSIFHNYKLN